jgi:hypothetical protein
MLYGQKHMLHWVFIVAYIGAGVYTAVRLFTDMQTAGTYGGYTLTVAAYSMPILFFITSTYRPKRP